METNNVSIITEGGHEIVMKPFITGRQALALSELPGNTQEEKNKNALIESIKILVISLDGKTENLVDSILDLPFSEYTFIVTKVTEIISGKKNDLN